MCFVRSGAQRHRYLLYLDSASVAADGDGPLFRTVRRGTAELTRTALPSADAYAMVQRRAAAVGIATNIGNHTFRTTGIAAYLKNEGTLDGGCDRQPRRDMHNTAAC